ncbi:MAG: translesion error-prone DNA polymerase V autoproteolytic subunit [Planctomycetota bacterium]|nr:translesion error-prone DNA polymerase V autoproteolytic subunit [Planctomycetota bacterium]
MGIQHEILDYPVRRSRLPLVSARVEAGFPSPAEDYIDCNLDLNEYLIRHPAATYFVRVSGNSMTEAGIQDGDLLIVDRALQPTDGDVVIAVLFGEPTLKRIQKRGGKILLVADNGDYSPIEVGPEADFQIWGVCRHVIHSL